MGEAVENKVVKETIKGLIRHILTAAGGALIANGTLSGNDIDLLAGAIVAVGGVVWSVFQKRKS